LADGATTYYGKGGPIYSVATVGVFSTIGYAYLEAGDRGRCKAPMPAK